MVGGVGAWRVRWCHVMSCHVMSCRNGMACGMTWHGQQDSLWAPACTVWYGMVRYGTGQDRAVQFSTVHHTHTHHTHHQLHPPPPQPHPTVPHTSPPPINLTTHHSSIVCCILSLGGEMWWWWWVTCYHGNGVTSG